MVYSFASELMLADRSWLLIRQVRAGHQAAYWHTGHSGGGSVLWRHVFQRYGREDRFESASPTGNLARQDRPYP